MSPNNKYQLDHLCILLFIVQIVNTGCHQTSKQNQISKHQTININNEMLIYPLPDFEKDSFLYFGIEHLPTHKVGVWHKTRGLIIPTLYTSVWQLENCKWLVLSKGNQYAIFDTMGIQITSFENNFQAIADASEFDEFAIVEKEGTYFLINPPTTNPINDEVYSKIYSFKENGFYAFGSKDNYLYALGSPEGKRLTDFKYPSLSSIGQGMNVDTDIIIKLEKSNRYLVAVAITETESFCLDNKGEEVPCK